MSTAGDHPLREEQLVCLRAARAVGYLKSGAFSRATDFPEVDAAVVEAWAEDCRVCGRLHLQLVRITTGWILALEFPPGELRYVRHHVRELLHRRAREAVVEHSDDLWSCGVLASDELAMSIAHELVEVDRVERDLDVEDVFAVMSA